MIMMMIMMTYIQLYENKMYDNKNTVSYIHLTSYKYNNHAIVS